MTKLSKPIKSIIKRLPGGLELLNSYSANQNNSNQDHLNANPTFTSDQLLKKFFTHDILASLDQNFLLEILTECCANPNLLISNFFHRTALYLADAGFPDKAAEFFEMSLNINYNNSAVIQYLQTLMYTSPDNYSHERIYYLTKHHMHKMAYVEPDKKNKTFSNPLNSDRILNIGYTCHFFDNSTGTTLFLPLLQNHNRNRVKIFIYSDQLPQDTKKTTEAMADVWRYTNSKSNEEFYKIVKNDQIDILVELNGFCVQNRYQALNMRPAPIQVSHYNLSTTSGVEEIDYVMAGQELKTDHLQEFYTEKFFHTKGIQFPTIVGDHFPETKKEIPYKSNGYITFGSFNQIHKVSREQVLLWSEVLKQVPKSRFYMKASGLDRKECVLAFQNHFQNAGIDLSMVILEGHSNYDELLECYDKIDIGLDTYPYGGGTTTIEALIQGVPIISLIGERFCSQHGYTNLYSVGHCELTSYSKKEFIEKAASLANDIDRITSYRQNLRNDVKKSVRSDIKKYMTELEDAYLEMWKKYIHDNISK